MTTPTLEEAAHAAHDAFWGMEYPSASWPLANTMERNKFFAVANAILSLLKP